ncbi:competence/damage-inducible protein A [Herbaspirillum robiniae]|uniref:Competence/damage-inducible protein A n=1 Tax=Herbaspirillum robiniae TaxID=2014887 RepID=A0A246WT76_9BURK|nr:molybdopterin-binding protein [Herbaspirillum robiniae]NUU02551.1 competence/damage-inducible protein A [Herbaspirillum robiniae]OWY30200.1 competence/damage-inducible protein A [Herbaspirillum robiniae]
MAFGLIIIGDEILSGRRIDKHFPKVLELLSQRGLQLSWAHYLGDEPEQITATLKRTLSGGDIVFCTGGIGATPDDHTRQCAAAALGVPLALHPEAKEKIRERIADTSREAGIEPNYDAPENLHRLKMGEFPQGASIIPNPYNKIPGFSVRNTSGEGAHYFAPGFPVMAWPMFEWVLETNYSELFHRRAWAERSMLVFEAAESTLTPLMELIEAEFPLVKVFSLPHVGDEKTRRHIDLGVKGDPDQVGPAFEKMQEGLRQLKAEFQING